MGPITASISPGITRPEMRSSSVCFGLATTPSSSVTLLDWSCPRGSSSVTNTTFCHTSPRAGVLQIRARPALLRLDAVLKEHERRMRHKSMHQADGGDSPVFRPSPPPRHHNVRGLLSHPNLKPKRAGWCVPKCSKVHLRCPLLLRKFSATLDELAPTLSLQRL